LDVPIFLEGKGATLATVRIVFERKEESGDEMLWIMGMEKARAWMAARMTSLHEYELEWNSYKSRTDALLEETGTAEE